MGSKHFPDSFPLQGVCSPFSSFHHVDWNIPSDSSYLSLQHRIPYVPYSKSDKITHVADWSEAASAAEAASRARGPTRGRREAYGASSSAAAAFGYVHDEDEKSFSLVDSGRAAAQLSARGRGGGLLGGRGRGRGYAARGAVRGRGGLTNSGRGGERGGYAGAYRGRGRGGYNSWDKVSDGKRVCLGVKEIADS